MPLKKWILLLAFEEYSLQLKLLSVTRSHLRLQLKVQSGFWLVLTEKSNSGFPVVNPAYESATKLALPNVVLEEETDFLPVSP